MKKVFAFSLIVVLIVILSACSDDSNPVTSTSPRVFDPFALWDTASGNLGNIVQCLAVKDTFLFAGTSDSGFYRSTNIGSSWIKSNTGLPSLNIRVLLVKDSNLFAATGGNGVYRSTDNGSNWTASNSGITTAAVYSLVRKDSNLFAGATGDGVYRSTDNGSTWVSAGLSGSTVFAFAVKGSRLFVGSSSGVYRSDDNGVNWTPINTGLPGLNIRSLAVQDTNLFAAEISGIFRSSNDSSWTAVNEGLYSALALGYPQSFFVYGSNILAGFTSNAGVYLSLNNGASWVSCNAGLPPFSAKAFTYNGAYIFMGGMDNIGHGVVWRHAL
jgi:photosystem II stability/assembly factor-like uncharacterized protein